MNDTAPRWTGIVGLAGYAGSGKHLVSNILYARHSFRTFALADNVREALLALDPMINSEISLRELVERFDWDGAKHHRVHGPEVYRLMQAMGTEVGRVFFGDDAWMKQLAADIEADGGFGPRMPVVVDDIHYDDEAAWIRSLGGQVWQVVDPKSGPLNNHPTEAPLAAENVDHLIINDGDVQAMTARVGEILSVASRPDLPSTMEKAA